jgi:hypothetical protein
MPRCDKAVVAVVTVLLLLGHGPQSTRGHGAVTHPRPRNGVDRDLAPWTSPMSQRNPNPGGEWRDASTTRTML